MTGRDSGGVTVATLLRVTIAVIVTIAMAVFWPMKLPEYHGVTQIGGDLAAYVDGWYEAPLAVEIEPELPYLDELDFILRDPNACNGQTHVRIWGYSTGPIYDDEPRFTVLDDGFVRAHLGVMLEPGKKYTIHFMGTSWKTPHSYGVGLDGRPLIRMNVAGPVSIQRVLFSWAILLAIGAALFYLVKSVEKRGFLKGRVSIRPIAWGLSALLFAVGAGSILFLKLFGPDPVNNVFLMVGVTIFCVLLPRIFVSGELFGGGFDLLRGFRSMALAGCMLSCVAYQNALSDYEHYVYYRSLLICLGLYLLSHMIAGKTNYLSVLGTGRRRIFWAVFVGALLIADVAYYYRSVTNWGDPLLAVENGAVVTLYALILAIPLVTGKLREGLKALKTSRPPAFLLLLWALAAAYAVMSLCFANGRLWPLVLFLAFGVSVFILGLYRVPGKEHLRRVSDAVLVSYFWVVLYSMMHRPYHAYILYRYGLNFHTVTMTSIYLLLVIGVLAVRLHDAWDGSFKGLFHCPAKLLGLGSALAFLFMTYSRNGLLSAALTLFALVILLGVLHGPARALKTVTLWAAAGILCFPVCFAAARILPAVTGRPEMFWIEPFTYAAYRGVPLDSDRYMTIERFLQVLGIKSRGLPEFAAQAQNEAVGRFWCVKMENDAVGRFWCVKNQERDVGVRVMSTNDAVGRFWCVKNQGRDVGVRVMSTENEALEPSQCVKKQERDVGARVMSTKNEALEPSQCVKMKNDTPEPSQCVILAAALPDNPIEQEEHEVDADQYSNGRLEIYRAYLSQLNMTGHEEMGAILEDGGVAVHAHNIYLQIAFDHGIPTGGLFVLLCGVGMFGAFKYRKKSVLPVTLGLAFCITGMAEWVSHLCNPLCFALLLAMMPVFLENDAPEPSQCVKMKNDTSEPSQCVKMKNDAPEPSQCVKNGV